MSFQQAQAAEANVIEEYEDGEFDEEEDYDEEEEDEEEDDEFDGQVEERKQHLQMTSSHMREPLSPGSSVTQTSNYQFDKRS